ncbi:isochorismatase family protein [Commensalibacter sp. ESL0366]|nr:isochorismatase family protein [Commensalibacter melissae]
MEFTLMKNTVLIIIDLQNDYYPNGKFPLFNMNSVGKSSMKVLAAARQHHIPVIHIQHQFPMKDAPFFVQHTEGVKINKDVKPLDNEICITKNYPNAFKGTELKSVLDRHNYKNLIVIGAMSQMCVDATVRTALDYGYQVTLIPDCIASKEITFNDVEVPAPKVHAAMLWILSFAGAKIMSKDEFLAHLS